MAWLVSTGTARIRGDDYFHSRDLGFASASLALWYSFRQTLSGLPCFQIQPQKCWQAFGVSLDLQPFVHSASSLPGRMSNRRSLKTITAMAVAKTHPKNRKGNLLVSATWSLARP